MSKITTASLLKMKQDDQKITAITAYDASFAKLFDDEGAHVLLIGDSLGMVLQGGQDTLAVSVDEMVYHTRCVARGASNALIIADMPFMSYATPEQTYQTAARLMAAGARMVKMEGGDWLCDSIRHLTRNGVPVCGHLGLTPQSVHVFGGFKVQGRDEYQAQEIYRQALCLQEAGIQLLVLECVPVALAERITKALRIPVIGIGAGPATDGQILVMHDAFGITSGYVPKFTKNFLAETGDMHAAIRLYVQQVSEGTFPGPEHSFN
ncbi:3-methyl-2-oxobutanoate hydroxymethyltransferase [Aeromonas salmonicida subsp. salmonicida]|jgi:3-methyl-2-oxobutanoate hydroxymethyltransferase|uniref:3-methyl-2-oxobutanoate hydroxymethyltransferase n=2 Tax=Aeromonas salmonicida subsp. salmonicida TaxID=29491 RepID=PANB_AERS4|nr:3-methyl-2-oxobutanoate hydroxymethyltransferase [Aeromonas salmonicida]A4SJ61.1 RecName: Full=3-methyl-2-oxobutanoate hydroxymethyltransferase; AltName: Full=Ketopantoate hydroxymethyltransferase; Short=KPHMT [Aeromonas salmonicida subsp. salmonicida A449]ABO88933.1 3-methyl-2-oxobutanoatehydroxymethyltransferase [Aeromonas salmonicida subsp. salmonicida A449]ASI22276.1 3-methyl-2-oxobutanoate hydroxymethyltransferase [Aeromonas salmonicida]ASI26589.1 3-methyl-2-oxobutanoate hydroxymethyltr